MLQRKEKKNVKSTFKDTERADTLKKKIKNLR